MYTANGETVDVVGVGDVCIALLNKNVWTLQQVKHVSNLKKSLVSMGQPDDRGHTIAFSRE